MEEYLETFITLLIGLAAFVISVLGKKKKPNPVGNRSFDIEFSDIESTNNTVSENETKEDLNPKPFTIGFESSIQREAINKKHLENNSEILNDIQHISNIRRKSRKKKPRKWFDAKKAIIYSEIINRREY
eukprot:Anaeramoba_ignava/a350012_24.p3 GENE.a350012_24~~a350012_24.p3  ORF type:complete len:130 (-),score=16.87 a350012_24:1045-1434(-)